MRTQAPLFTEMGKTQSFVLAGLLGGLLTYGAFRLVAWSGESEPGSGRPEATELLRLREQVRKLEGSVARSGQLAREAQLTAQAAQAMASHRREAPPAPVQGFEPPTPEKREERLSPQAPAAPPPEPSPQQLVEQMDEHFFGEEVDPDWSREALPHAERFGVLLPEGARVVSLQCRRSMCRLEMSHPSLESFQGFVHQRVLRGEHEWNGPIMTALQGDPQQPGELKAVAYLAREGIDLSPAPLEAP